MCSLVPCQSVKSHPDGFKESVMAHNAKYGVKFVGYSAYVVRKGHEGEYAVLDFVTGHASVFADLGWINSKRADLGAFVRTLPTLSAFTFRVSIKAIPPPSSCSTSRSGAAAGAACSASVQFPGTTNFLFLRCSSFRSVVVS